MRADQADPGRRERTAARSRRRANTVLWLVALVTIAAAAVAFVVPMLITP